MSFREQGGQLLIRVSTTEPMSNAAILAIAPLLDIDFWPNALESFRWFGDKGRRISSITSRVEAVHPLGRDWEALIFLDISYVSGADSTWFIPIVFERKPSRPALFAVDAADGQTWYGVDAAGNSAWQSRLFDNMKSGATTSLAGGGQLQWTTKASASELPSVAGRLLSGEQSNSSIVFGDQLIIKVMRRVVDGLNPDVELGRYLTQHANVSSVPPLVADLTLEDGEFEASIGIAQRFVPGAADGWTWLLEELRRAHDNPARQASTIDAIHELGVQTAQLHQAMFEATDPSIAPEPITDDDLTGWTRSTLQLMDTVGDALAQLAIGTHDPDRLQLLEAALQAWPLIGVGVVGHEASSGLAKTRVHGDYHLGQTLLRDGKWFIIDFEGEPARSLAERRARFSPLKDVAGMLRSIDYAKAMMVGEQRGWLDETNALNDAFIAGYRSAIAVEGLVPASEAAFNDALKPWVIDKAMYEILYELNNRPDWLVVPIAALLRYIFMNDLGNYAPGDVDAEP